MSWFKTLFAGKAAQDVDEKALVLAVRRKLLPYRWRLFRSMEELFVPVGPFLTALEMRAAGSPTLRLHSRPETVKAAARIMLQDKMLKGGLPFFYQDNGGGPASVGNVKLRTRDVAEHASWLLDRGQVALADAYAQALEDTEDDMETYAALNDTPGLSYNDGKDLAKAFAAKHRKNSAMRPC